MELISTNPTNSDVVNTWPVHSETEVNYILCQAQEAYQSWKTTDLSFRLDCLEPVSYTHLTLPTKA